MRNKNLVPGTRTPLHVYFFQNGPGDCKNSRLFCSSCLLIRSEDWTFIAEDIKNLGHKTQMTGLVSELKISPYLGIASNTPETTMKAAMGEKQSNPPSQNKDL